LVIEHVMFAEVFAMVGSQDDHGIVQQPAWFDVKIPRPVLTRIIRHASQQLPMPLTRRLHQQRHPPRFQFQRPASQ
jgi:hypothetical protein